MYDQIFEELQALLLPLERVRQSPRFHPEGDALFHSLQVYQVASEDTDDPVLRAAALLHDVGKAVPAACHAREGAAMLSELVTPRVQWLVGHHLDLLRTPRQTRSAMLGRPQLRELEALRHWDLAGRRPDALVPAPERALGELLEPGSAEAWLAPSIVEKEHDRS